MCQYYYSVKARTQTFLWTLEEKRTRDIKDCTPHISLLRSFKRIASAVQIPGWCLPPCFIWFRLSVQLTTKLRILKKVGALCWSSDMHFFHEKSSACSVDIWWNSGTGWMLLLHKAAHSEFTTLSTFSTMCSLSSVWEKTAFATDTRLPQTTARPILARLGCKSFLITSQLADEFTDIYINMYL